MTDEVTYDAAAEAEVIQGTARADDAPTGIPADGLGCHSGSDLKAAAEKAAREKSRLLAFYGVQSGHLPYRTADGQYNPVVDQYGKETYTLARWDQWLDLLSLPRR